MRIGLPAVALLIFAAALHAQSPESQELPANTLVTGQIESGETEVWSFIARDRAVLSFSVVATSGNLDPIITIRDSGGTPLIANDDFNYPTSQNALLQAITIPRADVYTAAVSGFGGTSGDYSLVMYEGFARIVAEEDLLVPDEWEMIGRTLTTDAAEGIMTLGLAVAGQTGIMRHREGQPLRDFHARVDIAVTSFRAGWIAGITARHQDDGRHYQFDINDDGQWRFLVHGPEGNTALRNWAAHPAITPGATEFSVALLARGSGFELFFNGQLIGTVTDDTIPEAGQVGITVSTGTPFDSQTVAQFSNLIVTLPATVEDREIIPDQIVVGRPAPTAQELYRRGLVAADGELALTVPESFVDTFRPGVARFPLGGGVTYGNLAIATTLTWRTGEPGPAGCGLVFHSVDEANYTLAYLDQTGGFGVSRRENNRFRPGIFGEIPNLDGPTHQLLVVAGEDEVILYVDGRYAGALEYPARDGQVGNAAVNFEPINTICEFTDTWVWRWN